jgi:hypothetical protein
MDYWPTIIKTILISSVIYGFYNALVPLLIQIIFLVDEKSFFITNYRSIFSLPITSPLYALTVLLISNAIGVVNNLYRKDVYQMLFTFILNGKPLLDILLLSLGYKLVHRVINGSRFTIILFTYVILLLLAILLILILL